MLVKWSLFLFFFVSSVRTNLLSGQDDEMEAAGYLLCRETFSYGLCVMAAGQAQHLFGPNKSMFCVYICKALQHFNIFIRHKETGVITH